MISVEDRMLLDEIQNTLTGRQLEVYKLLRAGYSQTEIAKMFGLSPKTIYEYLRRIQQRCKKMHKNYYIDSRDTLGEQNRRNSLSCR